MRTPSRRLQSILGPACVAAALVTSLAPIHLSHAAELSPIGVSGTQLVANGQEIVLKGVSMLDPLAMNRYIEVWEDDYFAQIGAWGANVVRLPIHPSEWSNRFYNGSGACTFPQSYQQCRDRMAVIEQAVAWAGEHDMYSIIDWHVIGSLVTGYFQARTYRTDQAETEDFWRQIATRFKGDPRVAAYELLNEPVTDRNGWQVSEAQWIAQRDWFERLVDVIREIDPDKPIICNGLDWGYNLAYAGANPVRRERIIYGAHPYPVKPPDWYDYFGYLKETYPVLATEFGFQNDGSAVFDESAYQGSGLYRTDLDTYLETNGIGWMAWDFSPVWEPTLIADWSYTPTEQGVFYRDRMLAASGNPPPPPPPPPSGGVMHVSGITMSFQATGVRYKATAVVTVVDADSQPVGSTTVNGKFSGTTSDEVDGITGLDGQATLTSASVKNGGTWTFCVTGLVKDGWEYDSAANTESCGTVTAP